MGIFSSIKNAIFGKKDTPRAAQPAGQPRMQPGQAPARAPAQAPQQQVDVESVLQQMDERNGQNLNWRTSIVDLMKLLGIESSLDNRKELARELGYTGELNGSAEMNLWLHKATMRELSKNGGRVPASMMD